MTTSTQGSEDLFVGEHTELEYPDVALMKPPSPLWAARLPASKPLRMMSRSVPWL
jgi:hypothetical protein